MSLEAATALLDAHHVAHLATAGEGGPHSAPVFFARLPGTHQLVWLSAPHPLHSAHLGADARAAVSVGPSAPTLALIEGVQLRGTAAIPDDEGPARAAWLARFPSAGPMVAAARDHRFYVFTPTWVRLVRTVAGVSQNQEWSFAPGAAGSSG